MALPPQSRPRPQQLWVHTKCQTIVCTVGTVVLMYVCMYILCTGDKEASMSLAEIQLEEVQAKKLNGEELTIPAPHPHKNVTKASPKGINRNKTGKVANKREVCGKYGLLVHM